MTSLTLSAKAYTIGKWAAIIGLPAVSTLYFGLSGIYGWDNAGQVTGTIACITTFLGVILGISTKNFNASDKPYDGEVVTVYDPVKDKTTYTLALNDDLGTEDIAGMQRLTFKVVAR